MVHVDVRLLEQVAHDLDVAALARRDDRDPPVAVRQRGIGPGVVRDPQDVEQPLRAGVQEHVVEAVVAEVDVGAGIHEGRGVGPVRERRDHPGSSIRRHRPAKADARRPGGVVEAELCGHVRQYAAAMTTEPGPAATTCPKTSRPSTSTDRPARRLRGRRRGSGSTPPRGRTTRAAPTTSTCCATARGVGPVPAPAARAGRRAVEPHDDDPRSAGSLPIGIAPAAMHGLAHRDGELASARGAAAAGAIHVVSTVASTRSRRSPRPPPAAVAGSSSTSSATDRSPASSSSAPRRPATRRSASRSTSGPRLSRRVIRRMFDPGRGRLREPPEARRVAQTAGSTRPWTCAASR